MPIAQRPCNAADKNHSSRYAVGQILLRGRHFFRFFQYKENVVATRWKCWHHCVTEGAVFYPLVVQFSPKMSCMIKMSGAISFWWCCILKVWYFLSFSAILATISKKWLILRAILKSRDFNISVCNRNTLVKMRGQSAFDDVVLSIYGVFSHFQPF